MANKNNIMTDAQLARNIRNLRARIRRADTDKAWRLRDQLQPLLDERNARKAAAARDAKLERRLNR